MSIEDIRQQLALAVKPIAKEFVERSIGHIDAIAEVEMDDGDVRVILTETLAAVLTEEGF